MSRETTGGYLHENQDNPTKEQIIREVESEKTEKEEYETIQEFLSKLPSIEEISNRINEIFEGNIKYRHSYINPFQLVSQEIYFDIKDSLIKKLCEICTHETSQNILWELSEDLYFMSGSFGSLYSDYINTESDSLKKRRIDWSRGNDGDNSKVLREWIEEDENYRTQRKQEKGEYMRELITDLRVQELKKEFLKGLIS